MKKPFKMLAHQHHLTFKFHTGIDDATGQRAMFWHDFNMLIFKNYLFWYYDISQIKILNFQ